MIICVCNNISDSQIREAIADGACSIEQLQARMPVASQCGTCLDSATEVLFECLQLAQRNQGMFYAA